MTMECVPKYCFFSDFLRSMLAVNRPPVRVFRSRETRWPAGLPKPVVTRLYTGTKAALAIREVQDALAAKE
jgi:hypothetical protein